MDESLSLSLNLFAIGPKVNIEALVTPPNNKVVRIMPISIAVSVPLTVFLNYYLELSLLNYLKHLLLAKLPLFRKLT